MNRIVSEVLPLSPDDGLASPAAGWFAMPDDDRFLTIDQDGSTNFGRLSAEEDPFVLFGDLVDQPLVLPGERDAGPFDTGPLSDLYSGRHGDMHLTVTDDGRVLGGLNGRDGSFNFGGLDAEEDLFVLSGDLIDQPLVLPHETTGDDFLFDPMSDLFTALAGDSPLTVTEDGQLLGGEPWIDTSGLYNWA